MKDNNEPVLPIGEINKDNKKIRLLNNIKSEDKFIDKNGNVKDFAAKMLYIQIQEQGQIALKKLYDNYQDEITCLLKDDNIRKIITETLLAKCNELTDVYKAFYPDEYKYYFDQIKELNINELDYFVANDKIEANIEDYILNGNTKNIIHTSDMPDIKIICAMPIEKHNYKGYGYNENEPFIPLKLKIEYKGHVYDFISNDRVRPAIKSKRDTIYKYYIKEALIEIQKNQLLKDFIEKIDFQEKYGPIKHFIKDNYEWEARIGDCDVYGKIDYGNYTIERFKKSILDLFKQKDDAKLFLDSEIKIYRNFDKIIQQNKRKDKGEI
jgi:hypothetical protein